MLFRSKVMFSSASVCLLFVSKFRVYAKTTQQIFTKFGGKAAHEVESQHTSRGRMKGKDVGGNQARSRHIRARIAVRWDAVTFYGTVVTR